MINYINTFPHRHLSSALHPSPPSSGPGELPPPTWTTSLGSCALWVLTGFGQREASREKQMGQERVWTQEAAPSGLRGRLPAQSLQREQALPSPQLPGPRAEVINSCSFKPPSLRHFITAPLAK